MRRTTVSALAARARSSIALCVVAACAHQTAATPAQPLRATGALVEVHNEGFDDLVIYVIRGSMRTSLGLAPGLSRRTLSVSVPLLGNGSAVVLGAGVRGGPVGSVTDPFDLAAGRIAVWVVRPGARTEQPVVRRVVDEPE